MGDRVMPGQVDGDAVGLHDTCLDVPASLEPRRIRYEGLYQEHAAVGQASRDILETLDLGFLGQWGKEGIKDNLDQCVFSAHTGVNQVTQRDGHFRPAWLLAESHHH